MEASLLRVQDVLCRKHKLARIASRAARSLSVSSRAGTLSAGPAPSSIARGPPGSLPGPGMGRGVVLSPIGRDHRNPFSEEEINYI